MLGPAEPTWTNRRRLNSARALCGVSEPQPQFLAARKQFEI